MTIPDSVRTFALGDLELEGGSVLPNARLTFRQIGQLNNAGDNCILMPTYYGGTHKNYDALIGPAKALDPERWCIVIPNMFGNGISTSPSHGQWQGQFPTVSVSDNVRAQERLLREHLGIDRLALVLGWSMGAMQAFAWAGLFPTKVARILPWCGAARCWPLNRVFLEGIRAALLADQAPGRPAGLRAFGRAYAGWAYSAAFFRDEKWRMLGFASLEDFLLHWEDDHAAWCAEDLLAMLDTWASADLTDLLPYIEARAIIMPCDSDSYFTRTEIEHEAALVQGAQLRVLRSDAGHCAGAPGRFPVETAAINAAIADLLATG
jgi:homoserine O-acetyltransferase